MRVYIINGCATRKKLDNISHWGYLMGYEATTGVILYWKPDQHFLFTELIMFGLMNTFLVSSYKKITLQVPYSFGNIIKFVFTI